MEFRLFKYAFKGDWLTRLREEKVFTISLLLAVATSFVTLPKLDYINFKVIFCLFNLMLVVCAFEELKLMDRAAVGILNRCENLRIIGFVMLALTFLSSMLVTNDVALITFVPLTLVISRKIDINPAYIIVLQTLAANIGSSLTPMGNPQNLFLFTFYRLSAGQFFRVMLPFVLLGALWLAVLNLVVPRKGFELQLNNVEIKDKRKALLFAALFAVIILSIFNVISYILAFILTITAALVAERKLLVKVDFFLLATFVCFFIFIGNLSHIQLVNRYLHYLLSSGNKSFFTSITLSQFISNVPASILTAGFTSCWKEILLGVNIGGMGTLIASLASLISYKLYVNDLGAENSSKYILKFTLYNVVSLLLFTAMNFVLLNLSLI